MFAILGVVLLATACLSSEPAVSNNTVAGGSLLNSILSIKDVIKSLGINIQEIRNLSAFPTDPELASVARSSTPEIVTKYGFKSEVHKVVTEDGYSLELHRIAGSPKSPPREGKQVCFLMHGIMESSAGWVLSGPNHGLGFKLADEGCDVWMGNSRGSRYSTNWSKYLDIITHHIPSYILHFVGLNKIKKHWSFSFHEIGKYDLPASIDFVLKKTGQSKLHYIGHSQGTTTFFVMMSERPEMNEKIEMMHAMAPVAFMSHTVSPTLRLLLPIMDYLKFIATKAGLLFIPPTNSYIGLAEPAQLVTKHVFLSLVGYKTNQLNATLLPVIFSKIPAGCSADQLVHFGQLIRSGHFRQYDHGFFKNAFHYGKTSPPEYNLANVKCPVALYHSSNDWIADSRDAQKLKAALPNVVKDMSVTEANFNHMDFLFGLDAPRIVYSEIIKSIKDSENAENDAVDA